ncbi:hypothetical protein Q9L58_007536 [Maublancomyces gigas]|uniref:Uncharacterized protein n=1 Tax=Discina gigas TaxID=1032678 RepID=A0ABR3GC75_9PEZI
MTDDNTNQKKQKSKWATSYSKMTIPEAEDRLGIALALRGTPVKTMLEGKSINAGKEGILQVKEKVYDSLVRQIEIEGYPTEADPDFKEANITDLVILIMHPILRYFRQQTGRDLHLRREKEIVAVDFATGGMEEFKRKRFLLEARKQCFLLLKDMRDNNGGGSVYGFITTGDSWRIVSYDGTFQMSEKMEILFDTMDDDKERWMKDYSILVDCIYAALSHGGIADS